MSRWNYQTNTNKNFKTAKGNSWTHLRVKLQTELLRTHLQGGSKPRNVMIRVWNVTGTNMTPTTQTRIHWNRPMLPILARKPSTLRVIVSIINCKRQERALGWGGWKTSWPTRNFGIWELCGRGRWEERLLFCRGIWHGRSYLVFRTTFVWLSKRRENVK